MRIISFLGLLFMVLLYGLIFDATVSSMAAGQICDLLAQNSCLIPQQVDRWLSIATVLLIAPVSCIALLNWFVNRRRLTTLFGWLVVIP